MKIYKDLPLKDFEFWSGAAENAKELRDEEFDILENVLIDLYPDGIDETRLNDLMWFDFNAIKAWIGICK